MAMWMTTSPSNVGAAGWLALAIVIAGLPTMAVRFIKEAVLNSMNTNLDQGLLLERRSFQVLFDSRDKSEGIRARLEKRAPHFERTD